MLHLFTNLTTATESFFSGVPAVASTSLYRNPAMWSPFLRFSKQDCHRKFLDPHTAKASRIPYPLPVPILHHCTLPEINNDPPTVPPEIICNPHWGSECTCRRQVGVAVGPFGLLIWSRPLTSVSCPAFKRSLHYRKIIQRLFVWSCNGNPRASIHYISVTIRRSGKERKEKQYTLERVIISIHAFS